VAGGESCPGWGAMLGRCGASRIARRGGLCQDCRSLQSGRACNFSDCPKGGSSKGAFNDWRCIQHHQRRTRGIGDDQPIRPRIETRVSPSGDVFCPACQEWKAPGEFGAKATSKHNKSCYCRSCWAWRRWAQKYAISPERFQSISDAQDGRCICGLLLADIATRPRGVNIDHDHKCCSGRITCGQCVRGILCTDCNHMVGYYERMPEWARTWPLVDAYLLRSSVAA
jgi:hypothetical protein